MRAHKTPKRPLLHSSKAKKSFDKLKIGQSYKVTKTDYKGQPWSYYVKLVQKYGANGYECGECTPYRNGGIGRYPLYMLFDQQDTEYDDKVPKKYEKLLDNYENK